MTVHREPPPKVGPFERFMERAWNREAELRAALRSLKCPACGGHGYTVGLAGRELCGMCNGSGLRYIPDDTSRGDVAGPRAST